MRTQIREILTQYGQSVTVCLTDADVSVRAFIQPVTEREEMVPDIVTGIGTVDSRRWTYLGQLQVEPGDRILWNDMAFQVCSSRAYYIGETPLYWWASLEQAKEAAK